MLALCPRCHRHLHASATACPFCAATVVFAGAVLAAVSTLGCGAYGPAPRDSVNNPRVPEPAPSPTSTDSAPPIAPAPAYGPPPVTDQAPIGAYGPPPH